LPDAGNLITLQLAAGRNAAASELEVPGAQGSRAGGRHRRARGRAVGRQASLGRAGGIQPSSREIPDGPGGSRRPWRPSSRVR